MFRFPLTRSPLVIPRLSRSYAQPQGSQPRPPEEDLPVYLHSLGGVYAVSYLPTIHPSSEATTMRPTTLGNYTPHPNVPQPRPDQLDPDHFVENKTFIKLMHTIIEPLVWDDPSLQTLAQYRNEGHITITDARADYDSVRVPDPSDIIATVLAQNGKLVRGSYEPGGLHRLITRHDGLLRIPHTLRKPFLAQLRRIQDIEEDLENLEHLK